jgi:Uma2 family endonuclease
MTTDFAQQLAAIPEEPPRRAKWARADLERFEASELWEDRKFELIEGELYDRMGKNRPHVIAMKAIAAWLSKTFGHEFVEQESIVEPASVDAAINRPEPDVAVLRQPTAAYADRHPGPADIRLLVEVSDSSLRFDLQTKASLYARAGIEDYCVLDINGRRLFVHRDPKDGAYQQHFVLTETESIAPLAAPEALFQISSALINQ